MKNNICNIDIKSIIDRFNSINRSCHFNSQFVDSIDEVIYNICCVFKTKYKNTNKYIKFYFSDENICFSLNGYGYSINVSRESIGTPITIIEELKIVINNSENDILVFFSKGGIGPNEMSNEMLIKKKFFIKELYHWHYTNEVKQPVLNILNKILDLYEIMAQETIVKNEKINEQNKNKLLQKEKDSNECIQNFINNFKNLNT